MWTALVSNLNLRVLCWLCPEIISWLYFFLQEIKILTCFTSIAPVATEIPAIDYLPSNSLGKDGCDEFSQNAVQSADVVVQVPGKESMWFFYKILCHVRTVFVKGKFSYLIHSVRHQIYWHPIHWNFAKTATIDSFAEVVWVPVKLQVGTLLDFYVYVTCSWPFQRSHCAAPCLSCKNQLYQYLQ